MNNQAAETIRISPRAVFVAEQSDPVHGRFAFGYEITIHNQSAQTITLTHRHWLIDHGNGKIDEVRGQGVVGETPTLQPGARYQYRSGAIIETPAGFMWGDYQFSDEKLNVFQVAIPRFALIAPRHYRTEH